MYNTMIWDVKDKLQSKIIPKYPIDVTLVMEPLISILKSMLSR